MRVNKSRSEKLLFFDDENLKKNYTSSTLFLLSVGGDEAPLSGTTFLLSFINAGRRICSSYDNFLIFGGNVKENGEVVRRYLKIDMMTFNTWKVRFLKLTLTGSQ